MYLGVSSYTWPWAMEMCKAENKIMANALQLLKNAAANDIRFVQICDNVPLNELSRNALSDLKDDADEKHISIQTGARGLTPQNIDSYISIASALGSPFIRMVIDDNGYEPSIKDIIKTINNAIPALKENKLMLAIENHDRLPSAMLKNIIISTSEEHVGICLDTANSLGAGEGIDTVLNTLTPYTVNVHIKDIAIKRAANKMGFIVEGTIAGRGLIDIPGILSRLKNTVKCKTATLELWSNGCDNPQYTLQNEQQWADDSIKYLKTLLA